MTMIDRAVSLTTESLPLDLVRQILLPPVRLVRVTAVAVAATVRHWEVALEGDDDARLAHARDRQEGVTPSAAAPSWVSPSAPLDLPVEEWPELSYADAQARLSTCDHEDLLTLLEYERSHGHRPQYTLLLEQRLGQIA